MGDGTIIFSRWDNAGQTRNNGVNLYRINPDGTGLSYLYGRHSHESIPEAGDIQFLRPQALDSGNLLVQLRPFESDDYASVLAEIDVERFKPPTRTHWRRLMYCYADRLSSHLKSKCQALALC